MPTTQKLACDVRDLGLAAKGKIRIEWAGQWMPVLNLIRKRFVEEQPLRHKNLCLSSCDHGNRKSGYYTAGWRCGRSGLRVEPVEHAG